MSWRAAKSLDTLRNQLNSYYPNRNKASDGLIGDAAHASTTSEHNPNSAGVVTAFDITHDLANGVDGNKLAEALTKDPRTWYIIWNRRIWEGSWQPYNGANPHDKHVHISVNQVQSIYDDARRWQIGETMTPELLNKLAYVAWNRVNPDAEVAKFIKAYSGLSTDKALTDIMNSSLNKQLRTKAANYDKVVAALQAEQAEDSDKKLEQIKQIIEE